MTALDKPLKKNEQIVYQALREQGAAMSAYDVIEVVKGEGLTAPPTVYRALNGLIDAGLVHKLESLNAFIACAHTDDRCDCHDETGHRSAAVFAVCGKCRKATEFEQPEATARLASWAAENDFALDGMTLELRGTCAECRKQV